MWESTPLDGLTPEATVGLALLPFAVAMLLRLLLGRSRMTRWSLALSTMWFAINVLLAPYSASIRQTMMDVGNQFR